MDRSLPLAASLLVLGCGAGEEPAPPKAPCPEALDAAQCELLAAMRLNAVPPARGNAYADDDAAARLGFTLFFDARFSGNNDVRCATCHEPEDSFGDALNVSQGINPVARNSQTILDAARMRWLFWDGRADSLWSQPLTPFEHPDEMGFTRLGVAQRVRRSYSLEYEAVFGPLPALADSARFPATGKPGTPEFDGMAAADQHAANQVFVNVGKALEAYMRKLVSGPSPFDAYLDGDTAAISQAAQRGIGVFFRAGCQKCHAGPLLSDEGFHNLGVPDADADSAQGRARGVELLLSSEFNSSSEWHDGGPAADLPLGPEASDSGAFRTPTLRNVALSKPYGHSGSFAELEDVVRFHLSGGGVGGVGAVDPLLAPTSLDDQQLADLLEFLASLNGEYPPLPWRAWPAR